MKKILFTLFLTAAMGQSLLAAEADSVLVEHHTLWNQVNTLVLQNPALHGKIYATDYSELALSYDYADRSTAFTLQEGTGHTLYNIKAQTYLRLSDATTVWGKAAYSNGESRSIRFNSVADYRILEPYILADTDGGKTQREHYAIEGGYATQLNRWLLGAELLFRADHEYRTYDPRMRAIVTDLTLRLGGAYEAKGYRWGATAQLNIYKQTDNVKFYRETGTIPEYQLTGLGAIYARFSGEVNNLYFKGGGGMLQLSAIPISGNGLYGNLSAATHHYERIAASLNSLPLTKLYRNDYKAEAGWKQQKQHDFALYAQAVYTHRLGDENIVGSSLSNNFPILTRLTMYKNQIANVSLNALYGQNKQQPWHIAWTGGYLKNKEEYVEPHRDQKYSRLYTSLEGQYIFALKQGISLTCHLASSYQHTLNSQLNFPLGNTEPELAAMLNHNYKYLKADYYSIDGSVRGDYAIKNTRYGIFAAISGGFIGCSDTQPTSSHESHLAISLGMTF